MNQLNALSNRVEYYGDDVNNWIDKQYWKLKQLLIRRHCEINLAALRQSTTIMIEVGRAFGICALPRQPASLATLAQRSRLN